MCVGNICLTALLMSGSVVLYGHKRKKTRITDAVISVACSIEYCGENPSFRQSTLLVEL